MMKKHNLIYAMAIILGIASICSCKQEVKEPKIAIFLEHIESIAKQEGISFVDAAVAVRDLGCTGVDFRDIADPKKVDILDSLGFEYASLITYLDYRPEKVEKNKEVEERTLAIMKERGVERVMLVPQPMAPEMLPEVEETFISHFAAFTQRLKEAGFVASVEDYDSKGSLCRNTAMIDRFMAASPDLGLTFDSGNFFFSGEDELEALNHFLSRVKHVHLKDRRSKEDLSCPAVGTGVIRIEEAIKTLEASGYDGWYTLEFFGSKHMLEDARESIAQVRSIFERI